MKAQDLKRILKLFSITTKGGSIPASMEGIKLEREGLEGTIKATATNTAVLTEVLFVDVALAKAMNQPRIIPNKLMDHLKAHYKEFSPKPIPAAKIIGCTVDFSGWPEVTEYVQQAHTREHSLAVCIDLSQLDQLRKAMQPEKGKHKTKFILSFGGSHDVIVVRNSEGDKGLLMPCDLPKEEA